MLKKFNTFSLELTGKQTSILENSIDCSRFETMVQDLINLQICAIENNRLLITEANEENFNEWVRTICDGSKPTKEVSFFYPYSPKNYYCNVVRGGAVQRLTIDPNTIQFLLWFATNRYLLSQEENYKKYAENVTVDLNGTMVIDYDYAIDERFVLWLEQNYFLSNYHISGADPKSIN